MGAKSVGEKRMCEKSVGEKHMGEQSVGEKSVWVKTIQKGTPWRCSYCLFFVHMFLQHTLLRNHSQSLAILLGTCAMATHIETKKEHYIFI